MKLSYSKYRMDLLDEYFNFGSTYLENPPPGLGPKSPPRSRSRSLADVEAPEEEEVGRMAEDVVKGKEQAVKKIIETLQMLRFSADGKDRLQKYNALVEKPGSVISRYLPELMPGGVLHGEIIRKSREAPLLLYDLEKKYVDGAKKGTIYFDPKFEAAYGSGRKRGRARGGARVRPDQLGRWYVEAGDKLYGPFVDKATAVQFMNSPGVVGVGPSEFMDAPPAAAVSRRPSTPKNQGIRLKEPQTPGKKNPSFGRGRSVGGSNPSPPTLDLSDLPEEEDTDEVDALLAEGVDPKLVAQLRAWVESGYEGTFYPEKKKDSTNPYRRGGPGGPKLATSDVEKMIRGKKGGWTAEKFRDFLMNMKLATMGSFKEELGGEGRPKARPYQFKHAISYE